MFRHIFDRWFLILSVLIHWYDHGYQLICPLKLHDGRLGRTLNDDKTLIFCSEFSLYLSTYLWLSTYLCFIIVLISDVLYFLNWVTDVLENQYAAWTILCSCSCIRITDKAWNTVRLKHHVSPQTVLLLSVSRRYFCGSSFVLFRLFSLAYFSVMSFRVIQALFVAFRGCVPWLCFLWALANLLKLKFSLFFFFFSFYLFLFWKVVHCTTKGK